MVRDQLQSSLLGRYTIERELGRGGMATVYLARDLKHQRVVALKVLDPELGAVLGAERFLSEIRVTANLQHPNLLPLFDSGEADGLLYYVMPFVDGETLRARLQREKQLRVDDAVRITVAVAKALGYAHEHGVIHRDLKPENILLHAGHPVVADFGIALAVSNAGGTRVTQTGLSLGTPQYMSPEQATGDRAIDGRTDIYSLAAVAYEMLTGEPPHTGTTAQAIIARLMTERPRPIRASRETVPGHVESAIDVALAKLPADRFASAYDFAHALEGHVSVARAGTRSTGPLTGVRRRGLDQLARGVPWLIAAGGVAAALIMWGRSASRPHAAAFIVTLPDSAKLSEWRSGSRVALSPDGTRLAYVAAGRTGNLIYLRALDDTLPRVVRGTERGGSPSFSPDGSWLLFVANGKLKKVAVAGGSPIILADSVGREAEWGDRNQILFMRSDEIWRISSDGGTPTLVARPDSSRGQVLLTSPHFVPGGRSAFVTIYNNSSRDGIIGLIALSDGKITELGERGMGARYTSSGHILFGRSGSLFAAPFSVRRARLTGSPVQLLEGVNAWTTSLELSVAEDGTLAYIGGTLGVRSRMVAVDRRGNERPLGGDANYFSWPRVSPDAKRVAVEVGSGSGAYDVWVFDVASQGLSRLTNNFMGVRPLGWSADGRRVLFLALEGGGGLQARRQVASIPWDLSAPSQTLSANTRGPLEDASVGLPHGVMAIRIHGYTLPGDISIAPLDTPTAMRWFVATAADEETPRLSPDQRFMAYGSDETGEYEVYVRPMTGGGGRIQVSVGGGSEPVWTRDGRGLFYRGAQQMMLATLTTAPELAVTRRDTLFPDTYRKENKAVQYDAFPSGTELLMLKLENTSGGRLIAVQNWQELLRGRGK